MFGVDWADLPILVTGATGFLGTHLVNRLLSLGAKVSAISLAEPTSSFPQHANVNLQLKDITDFSTKDVEKYEVVIHLAALSQPRDSMVKPLETFQINTLYTIHLLELLRQVNPSAFFIFPSTVLVYGVPHHLPMTEDHPTQPGTPYAASKLAAETAITSYHKNYDLPTTIFRLFNSYGPGQAHSNVVPTIIAQAQEKSQIELFDSSTARDFIFVEDVISAFEKAIETKNQCSGKIFNIGTGVSTKITRLVDYISTIMNKPLTINENPLPVNSRGPPVVQADITKIQKAIQWNPQFSLEEGLRRTIPVD
ncbi:MAG: NAD-dependent epimerase/dehydratase family protein [Candidatus Ranarchaeia archaeon]